MPYPTDTILVRKEPLEDVEIEVGVNKAGKTITKRVTHPLNKVRVLTPSPIAGTSASLEEWNGIGGQYSVVEPLGSFGPNENAPDSLLQRDYTVERLGAEPAPPAPRVDELIRKQQTLVSPEEAFAAAAQVAMEADQEVSVPA